jgi:hypothetical protein
MRWIILSLALGSALGVSACASGRDVAAVEAWKHNARQECLKDTDLIRRQQCVERVDTVSAERTRTEETRPRGGGRAGQ